MVKLTQMKDGNTQRSSPDIFRAAREDDPHELALAIKSGQTLNDLSAENFTPLHIAAINGCERFVATACSEYDFDPWILDRNMRTAFDHASARSDKGSASALYEKMYGISSTDFGDMVKAKLASFDLDG